MPYKIEKHINMPKTQKNLQMLTNMVNKTSHT